MPDLFAGTQGAPLARRLTAILARYPTAEPEWIMEVARAVIASLSGEPALVQRALLREVEELGQTITKAKSEIAALKIDDITASHIPFATDELDAIVSHTASATHQILESCETLDAVADTLAGETAAQLQDATTRIYEACGFQDITGQRITKVVGALKVIEAKVQRILTTFVADTAQACVTEEPAITEMLNGPQLPAAAMAQAEIDRLLASFD
jgi:chemotaxis protein CheZ